MRIAVIGGALQGVEATYLAQKAGWDVCLVDQKPDAPAKGLCGQYIQYDVTRSSGLNRVLADVDLILPALENIDALRSLAQWARGSGVPLIFDEQAYAVSSSKVQSNRLFEQLQLPMPSAWPNCDLPLVAKPSGDSGSRGVRLIKDSASLQTCFPADRLPGDWVLQEFLPGRIYSVEVIGYKNCVQPLHVTDLVMDASFDCKRVCAPSQLSPDLIQEFENMAVMIANAINLNGIMDVEVIRSGDSLKILEIDARLPSQTPITVFNAGGLNMVEVLGHLFSADSDAIPKVLPLSRGAILEHVRFHDGLLSVGGEHLMAATESLQLVQDFFGADEAITNFAKNRADWVATLIIAGADQQAAWRQRNRVIETIMSRCPVKQYLDLDPV